MPVLDGLEATRQIVADERLDSVRVVVLTNFGLDEYIFRALRAGATGRSSSSSPARPAWSPRAGIAEDARLWPSLLWLVTAGPALDGTEDLVMDRSRLEAFSDGVFAVAITLLALDLAVAGPEGTGSLTDQLHAKWPAFLAYLISFFMIGIVWVNHHALVRQITKVDRTLLFLNLVLLLFVVLIPFSTAIVADYFSKHDRDTQVAMMIYGGIFLGMSAGFGAIFEWTLHGERMYQPLPPEQHWPARVRFVGGGLVYVAAIVIALISDVASFALIALTAVYYIFERTPSSPGAPGDVGGEGMVARRIYSCH